MSSHSVRILLLNLLALAAFLAPPAQAGPLRLLAEEGPPFNFSSPQGPAGFSVDIVHELLRRTGDRGEIEIQPWARAYDTALREPDTVLFTITRTPEREELFHWVGPIMISRWSLYALADTEIEVRDMEQARRLEGISTYRADVRDAYLRGQGFENLQPATTFEGSVRMMLAGRVPAVIADAIGIFHQLDAMGLPHSTVKPLLTVRSIGLYIAFSKSSDPAQAGAWQDAFEDMVGDGTWDRLHDQWLPPETRSGFDAMRAIQ